MNPVATPERPQPPEATRITSWGQLDTLCAAPIHVRFVMDGQLVELPLRRITPAEQHSLDAIFNFATGRSNEVRPPLVPGTTDKYDFDHPDYQAKLEQLRRVARAMTVHSACPLLQSSALAQEPPAISRDEITRFVHSKLTDQLLDLIFVTSQVGGLDMAERVSFTSPLGSTPS